MRISMKLIKILFLSALMGLPLGLIAQGDIDRYLEAGTEDASKLLKEYLTPALNGFGYGINNGWYNTAKAHKTLGFDLTVTVSAVTVPSSKEFFTFRNSDYKNIRLASGETAQLPSVMGPNVEGPELEILEDGEGPNRQVLASFRSIQGLGLKDEIGINAVPAPMAQLGIGIAKNTDLKLRYIPRIDLGGDGDIGLFGIGVMHDVKQWIPGIKLLPFDLSALVGYTKLTANYDLEGNIAGENQKGEFSATGVTFQGIISKQFSVLTLYGALGYNSTNTNAKIKGTYKLEDYSTLEDPVDLSFGEGSMMLTAGFRLKLAILTLHADYTLNKYPVITAGIGFSVR